MNQSTSLKRILIVFKKEVGDNLRDRRSLISALFGTLIGPAILVGLIIILGKTIFNEAVTKKLELPVIGAENAPTLIQYLTQHGVEIVPAPDDPEEAVHNGDIEVVLIIPEGYGEDFKAGIPASVRMILDTSRTSSIPATKRLDDLIDGYSRTIGYLRLMARGINPVIDAPVAIEKVDVSTPQSQTLIFLNIMPYFIILVVFTGGMYVIIDTTAGERERGSLEPLLINPVRRSEFVLGKMSASLPFVIFAVLLTLGAFAVGFNLIPLEEYVGFQLSINLSTLGAIFLLSVPMMLLASGLQMVVATFTRSFKEAQTYVTLLPFIPALPGLGIAFFPVRAQVWMMMIPTFGQQILINQFMRGEYVNLIHVIVSVISTLIAAALLVILAIRLYGREKIIFGTK